MKKQHSRRERDEQADFEIQESAEKKTLAVWTSFDQIFGRRWSENFGSDPLGNADKSNRMQMWIDNLSKMSWPQVKAAINKIAAHQKPYDAWLPDLPSFVQFAGKTPAPPPRRDSGPPPTWVTKICAISLLRLMMAEGPFSEESLARLVKAQRQTAAKYNAMLAAGDLSKHGDTVEVEVIIADLGKQFRTISPQLMSPEEQEAGVQRVMRGRGATSESSSQSATPESWSL